MALCITSRIVYSSYCFMVSGKSVPPGSSRMVIFRILASTLSTVNIKETIKDKILANALVDRLTHNTAYKYERSIISSQGNEEL